MIFKKIYFNFLYFIEKHFNSVLENIYFDAENKKVVATNSKILVRMSLDEDISEDIFINFKDIKFLEKIYKGNAEIKNGTIINNDIDLNISTVSNKKFVDYKQIYDNFEKKDIVYRVQLNILLLEKIIKFIKGIENFQGKCDVINCIFEFTDTITTPIKITSVKNGFDYEILVMPCTCKKKAGFLGNEKNINLFNY